MPVEEAEESPDQSASSPAAQSVSLDDLDKQSSGVSLDDLDKQSAAPQLSKTQADQELGRLGDPLGPGSVGYSKPQSRFTQTRPTHVDIPQGPTAYPGTYRSQTPTGEARAASGQPVALPAGAPRALGTDLQGTPQERIARGQYWTNPRTGQRVALPDAPETESGPATILDYPLMASEHIVSGTSDIAESAPKAINPFGGAIPPEATAEQRQEIESARRKMLHGGSQVLQGVGEASTPLIAGSAVTAPLKTLAGFGAGYAASETAGAAAHKLGASPEAEEFTRQIAFFVPSAIGVASGLKTGVRGNLNEGVAGAEVLGGRAGAAVRATPDAFQGAVKVGKTRFGVNIPRTPTEAPAAPSEAAKSLGSFEKASGNPKFQAPPPPPGSQGPENLTPDVANGVMTTIMQAPPAARPGLMLEAHSNMVKWMTARGTFVGPDHKVYTVDSPASAKRLASKFINDHVEKVDAAAEEAQTPPGKTATLDELDKKQSLAPTPEQRVAAESNQPTPSPRRKMESISARTVRLARERGESVAPGGNPVPPLGDAKVPAMGHEMTTDSPAVQKVVDEATPHPDQQPLVMVKKETPEMVKDLAEAPAPVDPKEAAQVGKEDKESGRMIVQPSDDEMQNERLAGEAAPELTTKLSHISDQVDGAIFHAPLGRLRPQKNIDRVDNKVEDHDKPANTIQDYLAAQIAAETPKAKDDLVDALKKTFKVLSVEDKFLEGRPDLAGYPSTNVQVRLSNGSTAEVQIVPREVQETTDVSHRHYTEGRKAEEAGDIAARDKAHAEAARINGESLKKFKDRNGIKEPEIIKFDVSGGRTGEEAEAAVKKKYGFEYSLPTKISEKDWKDGKGRLWLFKDGTASESNGAQGHPQMAQHGLDIPVKQGHVPSALIDEFMKRTGAVRTGVDGYGQGFFSTLTRPTAAQLTKLAAGPKTYNWDLHDGKRYTNGKGGFKELSKAVDEFYGASETKAPSSETKPVKDETKHEFASTQINIDPGSDLGKAHAEALAKIPQKHVGKEGLEKQPHVTVRYGLKDDSPEGVAKIKEAVAKIPAFEVPVGKTDVFPATEHSSFDHPVIARLETTPELKALRDAVEGAGAFKEDNFPEYKPHVTLGYIKPEFAEQYKGGTQLEGHSVPIKEVTVSKRDGTTETLPLGAQQESSVSLDSLDKTERRVQYPDLRAEAEKMAPEERQKRLFISDKTNLPNRSAFDIAEKHGPAKAIAMSDADGLKLFNDTYGYEAGDALLMAKADALRKANLEAYHVQGDEFLYRGDGTPQDLRSGLEKARADLRSREFIVTDASGKKVTLKGVDFSYGSAADLKSAEVALKVHKAEREARGERGRGKLGGISQVESPKAGEGAAEVVASVKSAPLDELEKPASPDVRKPAPKSRFAKRAPKVEAAPPAAKESAAIKQFDQAIEHTGAEVKTGQPSEAMAEKITKATKLEPANDSGLKEEFKGAAYQREYFKSALQQAKDKWLATQGVDSDKWDAYVKQGLSDLPADRRPGKMNTDQLYIKVPDDGHFLVNNSPMAIEKALKGAQRGFAEYRPADLRPKRESVPRSPENFDNAAYIAQLEKEIKGLNDQKYKAGNDRSENGGQTHGDYIEEQLKAARENLAAAKKVDAPDRSIKGKPGERGFAKLDILVAVADLIKGAREKMMAPDENKAAKTIDDHLFKLGKQYDADVLSTIKVLKAVAAETTPADQEAIYHHVEDPRLSLTPAQQASYDSAIKPLMDATAKNRAVLMENGIPAVGEGYIHRVVQGRGSLLERSLRDQRGTGKGNTLSKAASSTKGRVMMGLTAEGSGRRVVVSIKGDEVVKFENGKATVLGPLRSGMTTKFELQDEKLAPLAEKIIDLKQQLKDMPDKDRTEQLGKINDKIVDLEKQREVLDSVKGRVKGKQSGYGVEPTFNQRKAITQQIDKLEAERDRIRDVKDNSFLSGTAQESMRRLNENLSVAQGKRARILERTDPKELEDKVWIDNSGKKWKINQATTKEIEQHTDLRYYKNAIASTVTDYLQVAKARRAFETLEAMKQSPEFAQFSFKSEKGQLPPDPSWQMTALPQFRDYYFEPHVAETLNRFAEGLRGDPPTVMDKIGNFMTASLLLNPIRHIYNIGNHWLVERGVSGTFNPLTIPRAAKAGIKAIKASVTTNADFMAALDEGAPMLGHRGDLQELHGQLYESVLGALERRPGILGEIARVTGWDKMNPGDEGIASTAARVTGLRLANNLRKLGQKAMWMSNDIFMLQSAYEKQAKNPGMEFSEAMAQTAKHIPDYRIPPRIMNSKGFADLMSNRILTMFSRYHYGVWKSYAEMFRETFSPESSTKDRAKGLDHLIMLGLLTFVGYELVDKALKYATGDKNARMVRSGASALPYAVNEMVKGNKPPEELMRGTFTPAVMAQAAAELGFNRDMYTGGQVYDPHDTNTHIAEDVGRKLASTLGPVQQVRAASHQDHPVSRFAFGQVGVTFPKSESQTRAQRLMHDILRQGMMMTPELQRSLDAKHERMDEGKMTLKEREQAIQNRMKNEFEIGMKGFTLEQAKKVYEVATPEEKAMMGRLMLRKKMSDMRTRM